jgi:hypothetical protein
MNTPLQRALVLAAGARRLASTASGAYDVCLASASELAAEEGACCPGPAEAAVTPLCAPLCRTVLRSPAQIPSFPLLPRTPSQARRAKPQQPRPQPRPAQQAQQPAQQRAPSHHQAARPPHPAAHPAAPRQTRSSAAATRPPSSPSSTSPSLTRSAASTRTSGGCATASTPQTCWGPRRSRWRPPTSRFGCLRRRCRSSARGRLGTVSAGERGLLVVADPPGRP